MVKRASDIHSMTSPVTRWMTPSEPTGNIMQIYDTMALRSQQITNENLKSALAKGDAALEHQVGEGKE